MKKNAFQETIGFYKKMLGDIMIMILSLLGGFAATYFDIFRIGKVLDSNIKYGLYAFFCLIISFPIILLVNTIKICIKKKRAKQPIIKELYLKEYDDINLSVFEYPWTEHQLSVVGRGFVNFLKIGLRVTNSGGLKIHCALRMMNAKYNGKGVVWNWVEDTNNQWVDTPNPIERKFIKWDEGYNESEGKIDISPDGGIGSLLFAESNPYNMEFWFWYVDGKSKNHQSLEGRYKVFVQLEGDCEKFGIKTSLRPVQFEVKFTYKGRKLENVQIRKAERV